jgi:hypothetical protein
MGEIHAGERRRSQDSTPIDRRISVGKYIA